MTDHKLTLYRHETMTDHWFTLYRHETMTDHWFTLHGRKTCIRQSTDQPGEGLTATWLTTQRLTLFGHTTSSSRGHSGSAPPPSQYVGTSSGTARCIVRTHTSCTQRNTVYGTSVRLLVRHGVLFVRTRPAHKETPWTVRRYVSCYGTV